MSYIKFLGRRILRLKIFQRVGRLILDSEESNEGLAGKSDV